MWVGLCACVAPVRARHQRNAKQLWVLTRLLPPVHRIPMRASRVFTSHPCMMYYHSQKMWRDEALEKEAEERRRVQKGGWQLATLQEHASFGAW